MKKLFCVMAVVMCSPSLLVAAEAVAETGGGDTMTSIARIGALLLEILQPVLAALVSLAAYKLAKRFGIQATNEQVDYVEKLANEAIDYAERWAKNKVKAGEKPSGDQKLIKAVDFINLALVNTGMKKKATDYLVGLIESQLEKKEPIVNNGA